MSGRKTEPPAPIDEDSDNPLLQRVYAELHALATAKMAAEGAGHTLAPTELVHEAWLRLQGSDAMDPTNKALYYHAAAESMRRILVDHARRKNRVKRGGGFRRMPINLADLAARENPEEILAVDDAIERMEEDDAQTGAVVRLRFFAGLSVAETAEALGLSERSVHRNWSYARARLAQMLDDD